MSNGYSPKTVHKKYYKKKTKKDTAMYLIPNERLFNLLFD